MSPVTPQISHDGLLPLHAEKDARADSKARATDPSNASPCPTFPPLRRRQGHYITLTITRDSTVYTTTILLGNTFPSSPQTTTVSVQTSSPSRPHSPGIATSTITGIVVGCIAGFLLLVVIFYIYVLRSRQIRRRSRRRGSSRSSKRSSRAGGGGGKSPITPTQIVKY